MADPHNCPADDRVVLQNTVQVARVLAECKQLLQSALTPTKPSQLSRQLKSDMQQPSSSLQQSPRPIHLAANTVVMGSNQEAANTTKESQQHNCINSMPNVASDSSGLRRKRQQSPAFSQETDTASSDEELLVKRKRWRAAGEVFSMSAD